jgi:hypothetical protein
MKLRPDLGHTETHSLPVSTGGYFCDVARAGNQPPTCVMLTVFASICPHFFW